MTPTAIGSSTAAHQSIDAASATSPTPEQQKAARDFEAIFLRQLMSSLEKSSGISGGQSSGGQVFRSMMVGALADTASEGGGIGLSEVILKAMLPPTPAAAPDVALHTAALHPAADAPGVARASLGGSDRSGVGDPAGSDRWGTSSRVLTAARRVPMMEHGATGLEALTIEGPSSPEGNGR